MYCPLNPELYSFHCFKNTSISSFFDGEGTVKKWARENAREPRNLPKMYILQFSEIKHGIARECK